MTENISPLYVFVVNANGYITHADLHYGGNLPVNAVSEAIPFGLFKPKWDGAKWVEGKTQAEIDEEAFLNSLSPSADEIEIAEFEIKVLNTLMEVGLI